MTVKCKISDFHQLFLFKLKEIMMYK